MSAKIELNIPENHPRYRAMMIRHDMIEGCHNKVVAPAGLIAQGRGEAFDYLMGEKTNSFADRAIKAAAAAFLLAEKPVISVNGNTAQLLPEGLVKLSEATGAPLEVNLFYRAEGREEAIEKKLKDAGAKEVYGIGENLCATIPELTSDRRLVDPRGILVADLVFVPLEDGDRTEALVAMGKKVITIDLNPISRTPRKAHISIIDNLVRAVPKMIEYVNELKKLPKSEIQKIIDEYDNKQVLRDSLLKIADRLTELSKEI